MKKGLLSLIVLLSVTLFLIGCGTSATTPATSSSPAMSTTVKTTAATSTAPTTTAAKTTTTTPAAGPKYGGTLTVIYDSSPAGSVGYPPELTSDATTAPQLVIEPLLKENNKGEFTPWLAESYKLADDRMSITFTLRKGIQFHDGSNFDATVAKWNMDNQIAAKKTSTWASVDLIDQYTVRVNFTKWQNTNLSGFSGATSWMISKAAFDKNGLDWVRQNPIGTGPFKFVSFLKDTSFKTTRNTNYWRKDAQGNQLPYLNAVTFLFITDPVTQESAMKAGEADMLTVKHGSKVASDLAAVGFTVKSAAIDTSVLFGDTINADSPWSNLKVRQAAECAIDRDAIAKMGYGFWKPAYQIPGSADVPYDPNFSLYRKYDVAAAKQLLTDAGYPSGFTTSLIACPFNLNQDVVVAIQGYLAKVGIKADIQYPDAGKFTSDITLGKWKNGLVYEPIAGFPNYMTIFSALFNPVTNFHPSWLRTPEWLAAYSAAMAAPAPDAKLMRAFTDLMVKDDSMIPVNEGGRGWAYMSYVKDIGVLETQLPPYLNFENGWLDK